MGSGVSQTRSSRPSWPWPSAGPRPGSCPPRPSSSAATPRRSGPLLQAALSAGLATEGADVIDLGVLPTPGVATVAERRRLPGAMVSASHNPFGDNGIKLFSSLGTKLPVGLEADVEREIASILADPERPPRRPTGYGVGRIIVDPDGGRPLPRASGGGHRRPHLRRACTSWSTAPTAPPARSRRGSWPRLGATVTTLHDTPDGANINEKCGSTDPGELARTVAEQRADLGLALDGDADRVDRRRPHRDRGGRRRPPGAVRPRPGRPGPPGRQHGRGDGHDQPRIPPGHGVARHRRAGDRRGRPPRAGRARRRRPRPGRRAVGPHHLPHAARPPATASSPGSPWPTSCSARGVPWPTWPTGWSSGCRRSCVNVPIPQPGRLADCDRGLGGGGRGRGRARARRAGCSCARAGPSPWCG